PPSSPAWPPSSSDPPPPTVAAARSPLRRTLVLAGLLAAAVWLAFFDSHSLVQRVRYAQDRAALRTENARLEAEIERLERATSAPLSDARVVEIAPEAYGMRRPGERVYPVVEVEG
ncbi:MAG: septum formation initiator family protein, partial [Rhodothermales bacterium]|nr:septum formation initiator family protein [Rhodothermales bacterium]